MKKLFITVIFTMVLFTACKPNIPDVPTPTDVQTTTEVVFVTEEITTLEQLSLDTHEEQINVTVEPIITPQQDDELQLMAKLVYAEAGNQDDMGKRLVIDCILNRVDDSRFPSTITNVMYQQGQFDSVHYANQYPLDEHIYNLIIEEIHNRTNSEVLYFRANHYHPFGTPVMQYQDHYFSK